MAAGQSRFLVEEGKLREAVELLLDTILFGEDIALNGSWLDACYGFESILLALNEVKDLLISGALPPDVSLQLERELEILDRGFPREAEARLIDPMQTGFDYLRAGNVLAVQAHLGISDPARPTWLYGFSDRLVLVDAVQSQRIWSRRWQEAAAKPWSEAREIQKIVGTRAAKTWNPLLKRMHRLQAMLSTNDGPDNIYRKRLAQLRLVRVVSGYRASGSLPVLDDPFGGRIRSSISGTHLKVWSVGKDGIDDGGSGEWNSPSAKDIVLEVKR